MMLCTLTLYNVTVLFSALIHRVSLLFPSDTITTLTKVCHIVGLF